MWAKASISPLPEPTRKAGEARQRRSSTYPQAFLVNLPRCAIAQALVLALRVVKVQPGTNAGLSFGHCRISVEVDLLVFQAAPQPLDENVGQRMAAAMRFAPLNPRRRKSTKPARVSAAAVKLRV